MKVKIGIEQERFMETASYVAHALTYLNSNTKNISHKFIKESINIFITFILKFMINIFVIFIINIYDLLNLIP
jgi:hypothetical protein